MVGDGVNLSLAFLKMVVKKELEEQCSVYSSSKGIPVEKVSHHL